MSTYAPMVPASTFSRMSNPIMGVPSSRVLSRAVLMFIVCTAMAPARWPDPGFSPGTMAHFTMNLPPVMAPASSAPFSSPSATLA
jgi:hypothetical protein